MLEQFIDDWESTRGKGFQMKHDYILTLKFSTKQPIDKLVGGKTFELINEIGNAIRKVLDIYHMDINSAYLKMDEHTLEHQDADGNYRLRKL